MFWLALYYILLENQKGTNIDFLQSFLLWEYLVCLEALLRQGFKMGGGNWGLSCVVQLYRDTIIILTCVHIRPYIEIRNYSTSTLLHPALCRWLGLAAYCSRAPSLLHSQTAFPQCLVVGLDIDDIFHPDPWLSLLLYPHHLAGKREQRCVSKSASGQLKSLVLLMPVTQAPPPCSSEREE